MDTLGRAHRGSVPVGDRRGHRRVPRATATRTGSRPFFLLQGRGSLIIPLRPKKGTLFIPRLLPNPKP